MLRKDIEATKKRFQNPQKNITLLIRNENANKVHWLSS